MSTLDNYGSSWGCIIWLRVANCRAFNLLHSFLAGTIGFAASIHGFSLLLRSSGPKCRPCALFHWGSPFRLSKPLSAPRHDYFWTLILAGVSGRPHSPPSDPPLRLMIPKVYTPRSMNIAEDEMQDSRRTSSINYPPVANKKFD